MSYTRLLKKYPRFEDVSAVPGSRNLAERVLLSENRYQGIAEKLPVGIFQSDLNGKIIHVNPALARILRFKSPTELLTHVKELRNLYVDPSQYTKLLQKILVCPDAQKIEVEFLCKDNSTVWVSQQAQVLSKEGNLVCVIGIVEDITTRRYAEVAQTQAAEAALESARCKSEFLSTMSHEIRTPLHGILGLTNLLNQTTLNHEQKELLKLISSCGEGLLSLINSVLDFSKIESGGMRINLANVNLAKVIDEVINPLAVCSRNKSIRLEKDIDPLLPSHFFSDGSWIRQILNNLVGNAVKFTPPGGQIVVAVTGGQLANDMVPPKNSTSSGIFPSNNPNPVFWMLHFTVRDSGIGVPEEKLHRLFKPFSQADVDTARTYGGTGLGLAICHRLCEMLGGVIWLESEPGLGSSFEFTIKAAAHSGDVPVEDSENRQTKTNLASPSIISSTSTISACLPSNQKDLNILNQSFEETVNSDSNNLSAIETGPSDEEPLPALSILLTEDNQVNQRVALGLLKQIGHDADIAHNGIDALEKIKTKTYDVVLMDIQMPEMDGFEASRQIKQFLGNKSPYIIAMTANAMEGDRERCIEAGMDDYLAKPVKAAQLKAALREGLKKKSSSINEDQAQETNPTSNSATTNQGVTTVTNSNESNSSQVETEQQTEQEIKQEAEQKTSASLQPADLNRNNLEALRNLQMDGEDGFLKELIDLFLKDAEVRFKELDNSLAEHRAEDFTRAAHSVKGACANFGATELGNLCAKVEQLGRAGDLGTAAPLLPSLRLELQRVRLALEEEIGNN